MKNKKGFTLIELLAVIVVLAIIALIATPIVMNTIKKSKKGAAERSADSYIKQVETAVAEARINGTKITNGTYNIQPDGNLCPVSGCGENDKDKITIDMSGNKPTKGTTIISNGGVSQIGTTMTVGDYDVIYKDNKYTAVIVVYSFSTDKVKIGDAIDQSNTSKFTKDPGTLGKSIYLKHVLNKDNTVKESYVCVKYNSQESCLTKGEYGDNFKNKGENYLILKSLNDSGVNCTLEFSGSRCSFESTDFYLYADKYGPVSANKGSGHCSVNDDGSSICR